MKIDTALLPPISVFIPVYNAENIVENTARVTYSYVANHFLDFEIVIVDDASNDSTRDVLKELIVELPKIRLIENTNGPSRRENLGHAMLNAQYDIVFYQDVDLSVELENIKTLIEKICSENFDIVIGSRFKGIKAERSFYRMILSMIYNLVLQIFFRSKVKDSNCGFKAFKKPVLLELLVLLGYDSNFQRGWFWDAELMMRSQWLGYRICEIPVKWKAGKKSSFSLFREMKMLRYMTRFTLLIK